MKCPKCAVHGLLLLLHNPVMDWLDESAIMRSPHDGELSRERAPTGLEPEEVGSAG